MVGGPSRRTGGIRVAGLAPDRRMLLLDVVGDLPEALRNCDAVFWLRVRINKSVSIAKFPPILPFACAEDLIFGHNFFQT